MILVFVSPPPAIVSPPRVDGLNTLLSLPNPPSAAGTVVFRLRLPNAFLPSRPPPCKTGLFVFCSGNPRKYWFFRSRPSPSFSFSASRPQIPAYFPFLPLQCILLLSVTSSSGDSARAQNIASFLYDQFLFLWYPKDLPLCLTKFPYGAIGSLSPLPSHRFFFFDKLRCRPLLFHLTSWFK